MWGFIVKTAALEKQISFYNKEEYDKYTDKLKDKDVFYEVVKETVDNISGNVDVIIRIPFNKYDYLGKEECL